MGVRVDRETVPAATRAIWLDTLNPTGEMNQLAHNMFHAIARLASSTRRSVVPRPGAELYSRTADNWKRARIVGCTLGVIAVCLTAFVAYGVVTGT